MLRYKLVPYGQSGQADGNWLRYSFCGLGNGSCNHGQLIAVRMMLHIHSLVHVIAQCSMYYVRTRNMYMAV